jgi:hypothetical protein
VALIEKVGMVILDGHPSAIRQYLPQVIPSVFAVVCGTLNCRIAVVNINRYVVDDAGIDPMADRTDFHNYSAVPKEDLVITEGAFLVGQPQSVGVMPPNGQIVDYLMGVIAVSLVSYQSGRNAETVANRPHLHGQLDG